MKDLKYLKKYRTGEVCPENYVSYQVDVDGTKIRAMVMKDLPNVDWEHIVVSLSDYTRLPTEAEIGVVQSIFFNKLDEVHVKSIPGENRVNLWHKKVNFVEAALRMETLAERDGVLEELWKEFGDIPMNPETECIEETFLNFPPGTERMDIWEWFDSRHSKGVVYLLYGDVSGNMDVQRIMRLKKLCVECDSAYCTYAVNGECRLPFVRGRGPALGYDGCEDYLPREMHQDE